MSCAETEEENVPGKLNSKYKGCSMIEEWEASQSH